MFDAEHFFDGYKANPDYAMACLAAAEKHGARWLVLCDTNGGTLPHEIERIVGEVAKKIPGDRLGIHTHNDTENAVANTLAAVRAGVRQVQGTINGLGERCGNANMISLIPNLVLKMGFETGLKEGAMQRLTHLSRLLDDRLNVVPNRSAAYVGTRAFAHKGGLHVSAVEKDPKTYEHVDPETRRQPAHHRGQRPGRPLQHHGALPPDRARGRSQESRASRGCSRSSRSARPRAMPMTAPTPRSSCWRGTSCTPCPTTSPCRVSACWPSGGSMPAAS